MLTIEKIIDCNACGGRGDVIEQTITEENGKPISRLQQSTCAVCMGSKVRKIQTPINSIVDPQNF